MRSQSKTSLPDLLRAACGRSTCRNVHLGAVIETPGGKFVLGWNGPPGRAGDHPACRVGGAISRENIRDCPGVHAEVRAICRAAEEGTNISGGTLYLSEWFPCAPCAVAMIEAGIRRLVVTEKLNFLKDDCYNFRLAKEYLDRAGVEIEVRPELSCRAVRK
jgi:deoxycytidylate deaminase